MLIPTLFNEPFFSEQMNHYLWMGKPCVRHPNTKPGMELFRRDKELDPTGQHVAELTVFLEGLPEKNPYAGEKSKNL